MRIPDQRVTAVSLVLGAAVAIDEVWGMRVDWRDMVEHDVIVELKALSHPLTSDDLAQAMDYLAATGYPVALLLNFGRERLEYRRILPPRKIADRRRRSRSKPARLSQLPARST